MSVTDVIDTWIQVNEESQYIYAVVSAAWIKFQLYSFMFIARWESQELDEIKNKFHVTWHGEITNETKYVIFINIYIIIICL